MITGMSTEFLDLIREARAAPTCKDEMGRETIGTILKALEIIRIARGSPAANETALGVIRAGAEYLFAVREAALQAKVAEEQQQRQQLADQEPAGRA